MSRPPLLDIQACYREFEMCHPEQSIVDFAKSLWSHLIVFEAGAQITVPVLRREASTRAHHGLAFPGISCLSGSQISHPQMCEHPLLDRVSLDSCQGQWLRVQCTSHHKI